MLRKEVRWQTEEEMKNQPRFEPFVLRSHDCLDYKAAGIIIKGPGCKYSYKCRTVDKRHMLRVHNKVYLGCSGYVRPDNRPAPPAPQKKKENKV